MAVSGNRFLIQTDRQACGQQHKRIEKAGKQSNSGQVKSKWRSEAESQKKTKKKKPGTIENTQKDTLEWQNMVLIQSLAIIHNKTVI